MSAERGQMLSHYRLVDKIGEGGMGVVWKAEDTVLNRAVAIKVLPADLALDEERRQLFLNEARLAASVSHAHIVQVYELGRESDLDFIVMEYVDGQPLNKLLRGKPLPPDKVADWGLQVAEGLARAHRKGLIHRDLKPSNILVTPDGEVKLVDFGLAVLFEQHDSTASLASVLTDTLPEETRTRIAGTLPYMSPEQVRGEKLDARSDIFSFGTVLYEMTTGQRPFRGAKAADIAHEILKSEPQPVHGLVPKVPMALHQIIEKVLARRPEERYQIIDDVAVDLRRLRKNLDSGASSSGAVPPQHVAPPRRRRPGRLMLLGGALVVAAGVGLLVLRAGREPPAPVGLAHERSHSQQASQLPAAFAVPAASPATGPDPKSIAVLSFVNMSEDKANEYFSDGVSEELLNLLAKVPQLKVSARTSSFSFKGKDVEITEIARQLHVANVLEGSVRKSGNQVRITAQLIHAADGYHMWSQTWDRRLDDIFKIQEEIAADVVKAMELTLLGAPPKARTTDPQAYALYLQAIQVGRQLTAESVEKSEALLRQVLTIDPRYAPAWMGLGFMSFAKSGGLGLISLAQGYAAALEATEKALAIDPDYAPAHLALGQFAVRENDLVGAARHYERALMLDPTDLGVVGSAASFLVTLGRLDEVLVLREAIVRRDPVNHIAIYFLGNSQRFAGRFDDAIASYRTALSLSPGWGSAHAFLGVALLQKGDAAGALAEIDLEPFEVWRMICLPMAYHALGRRADSDAALAALIAKYEKDSAYNIAYAYAFRGEADQAFAWLDKAVEYGDPGIDLLVVDNLFARIHSDPRWLPFLRRIGRAPEQLAKIEFKIAPPD